MAISAVVEAKPRSPGTVGNWSTGHAAIVTVFAVVLSVATAVGIVVPGFAQTLLLAGMTAVVGIPHGGLDHRFGRAVCRPWAGNWWPIVFAAAYLVVGSLVLVGWVIAPLTTIALFFLMSAVHFGEGKALSMGLIEGGMIIYLPFLARPDECIQLLARVTPGQPFDSIQAAAVMARPILCMFALVLVGRVIWLAWIGGRDRNPAVVLESLRLTAFAGLFATTPVLLGFVTYFCGWHSTRELRELARQANPTYPFHGLTRVIRESASLTLVVVLATAFAAWWRFSGGHSAELVTVQAVFLGLSAVAVPHILLHAIARKLDADPFSSEANG